jgi:transposase
MDPMHLTFGQRRRLHHQLKATHDARLYRRTLAVLEVSRGRPVPEIARALGVNPRRVYYWVEAYTQAQDPTALRDRDRSGRPSRWTEEHRDLLRELFQRSPQELGSYAVDWTVPLRQEHLEHQSGQWLSDDTIRRELQRQGYVWKRSRYVLDPDPEREKKTPYPQASPPLAAAQCPFGGGRDRAFAVSGPAGGMVLARATQGGPAQRA